MVSSENREPEHLQQMEIRLVKHIYRATLILLLALGAVIMLLAI